MAIAQRRAKEPAAAAFAASALRALIPAGFMPGGASASGSKVCSRTGLATARRQAPSSIALVSLGLLSLAGLALIPIVHRRRTTSGLAQTAI